MPGCRTHDFYSVQGYRLSVLRCTKSLAFLGHSFCIFNITGHKTHLLQARVLPVPTSGLRQVDEMLSRNTGLIEGRLLVVMHYNPIETMHFGLPDFNDPLASAAEMGVLVS